MAVLATIGGSSTEGGVLLHPFQRAQVEHIDTWALATELVTNVSSYHHHLSVPDIAGVSTTTVGHGLTACVNLDPSK
jgi:hypothetical protein